MHKRQCFKEIPVRGFARDYMRFTASVDGVEEIAKLMQNMPRKTARKATRPALRAGGEVVRQAAEVNLREAASAGYATGLAARNVRVYVLKRRRGAMRVGVQIKRKLVNRAKIVKGEPVRVGMYVAILEYGKKNQPPRSWIRKAIRERKDRAIYVIYSEVRKNLQAAINDAKRG